MTSVPHSHIPYGESGSGHYGDWLASQDADNIAIVKDKIFKAVGKRHNIYFSSSPSSTLSPRPVSLSVCLSVWLSLSVCLSLCLSLCLCQTVRLSLSTCLCQTDCLSVSLAFCLCQTVSVFLYLSAALAPTHTSRESPKFTDEIVVFSQATREKKKKKEKKTKKLRCMCKLTRPLIHPDEVTYSVEEAKEQVNLRGSFCN